MASLTDKPLLAKEFIIDRRQIARAAAGGASAVLLIAAILEAHSLAELIRAAENCRCDVLLEVHDEEDVAKAAKALDALGGDRGRRRVVFGINNRNLDTLDIDLKQTERLAPLIRERFDSGRLIIAESGIESPDHCRRLAPLVDGFLVGTSLLQSPDPADYLQKLISVCVLS